MNRKLKDNIIRIFTDKQSRDAFIFKCFNRCGVYNNLSDEDFLKKKYKQVFGVRLNLDNPQTYNEKLQWLKLYDRKKEYTKMVDKYEVKKYVADTIGKKYVIPTIDVWNSVNDIDFDKLPKQFVLKCTHDSGGVVICKDKDKFNFIKAKKVLTKAIKKDFYKAVREWPYKNVKHRIIAEEYITDEDGQDIKDYKFYCFNGKVKCIMVNSDRNSEEVTKADYFDENFNWLNFTWGYQHSKNIPCKPQGFEEMKRIAEILSKDLIHVRIDLYYVKNKIFFGEITFYDGSGFSKIEPKEWDLKLGSYIKLPQNKEIR